MFSKLSFVVVNNVPPTSSVTLPFIFIFYKKGKQQLSWDCMANNFTAVDVALSWHWASCVTCSQGNWKCSSLPKKPNTPRVLTRRKTSKIWAHLVYISSSCKHQLLKLWIPKTVLPQFEVLIGRGWHYIWLVHLRLCFPTFAGCRSSGCPSILGLPGEGSQEYSVWTPDKFITPIDTSLLHWCVTPNTYTLTPHSCSSTTTLNQQNLSGKEN